MRPQLLLLLAVGLVLTACTDARGGTDAAPTATSVVTTTATTQPPPTTVPVGVVSTSVCGPADGPWIDVRVTGTDETTVAAELVVDGQVVAYGGGPTSSNIGIDLQRIATERWRDPHVDSGVRGSVAVVDTRTGEVLGTDPAIAPLTAWCG